METVGLIFSFAVILQLTAKRVNLALTLLLGSLIIAITSGMGAWKIIEVAYTSALDPSTLTLTFSVVGLQLLGYLMKKSGLLEKMVNDLTHLITDPRALSAVLPMVLGMLVVPGGAIMSAPMVEQAGKKAGLSRLNMAAVNLAFRHLWYFIYPLFPLFIMARDLSGLQYGDLIKYLALPTLVSIIICSWVCFSGSQKSTHVQEKISWSLLGKIAVDMSPIFTIIFAHFILGLNYVIAISVGLIMAGYFLYQQGEHNSIQQLIRETISHLDWKLGCVVLAVMMLKGYVVESGTINMIVNNMIDAGLPLLFLTFFIPFTVGMLTASHYTGVGIGFAVFAPIIDTLDLRVAYYAFIFITAVTGYFMSPIHLCYILTKEYFSVDMKDLLLKKMAPPVFAMIAVSMLTIVILGLF
ncbi:MAG: DUF401 family protein [bacterium]|jgi:integral membrane protein (TIGR00529 family)